MRGHKVNCLHQATHICFLKHLYFFVCVVYLSVHIYVRACRYECVSMYMHVASRGEYGVSSSIALYF